MGRPCRLHGTLRIEELEPRIAPASVTMLMNPLYDSGIANDDQITNQTQPQYFLIVETDNPFEDYYIYIDWKGDEDDPTMAYPDAEDVEWWGREVETGVYLVTPAIPLYDGYYSVNVLLVDEFGLPEAYTVSPTVIDTTPPPTPPAIGGQGGVASVNLRDGDPAVTGDPLSSDTGISGSDNVTNIINPTFDVTRLSVTPYDFYRIYRSAAGEDPVLVSSNYDGMGTIGADGEIYRLFAVEDEFGEVTLVPSQETLDDQPDSAIGNPWFYTLRAVDLAGNESADGPGLHVYIDTVRPDASGGATEIDLMPGSDSGIFNNDNYTNDYTPTFEVRNISATAGTEDFGLYFRIYRYDGTHLVEISSTPIVGDDGHIYRERDLPPEPPVPPWGPGEPTTIGHETLLDQQTPYNTPSENVYVYYVVAVDRAGNLSEFSPGLTVTIDTLVPEAPTDVDLDASTDSGAWDNDNYTNFTKPRLNVTVNDESQDYWQLYRVLWGQWSSLVCVSTSVYVGADGQVYRGSGDPYSDPWPPGSGYEILAANQPDSVDQYGRPIPYVYMACSVDIAGNRSLFWSPGLTVIIDTTPPPVMTLGDPRPAEPLPDEPIQYVPGETEPIHTNWPTFEWPYAMIPAGPTGGAHFDPTKQDCYLTTYWIRFDGGTGPEFEYDTRYGSNWNPDGYGDRPFTSPLPPLPQDDPATEFDAPGIIYRLPTGGPQAWMLNRGLSYGFHTWQIRAEDLAGNVNEYSNALTFMIDTFTDADGDIIRLDVDRMTLKNAGMNPTLTVSPGYVPPGVGARPGTTDIASILIAHTYDGSLLHFYIDPDNPNEPGIGPGNGRFTVGDVSSAANVAVGMISVGIARDWTPSNPGRFEGIGSFHSVSIGGNRLGALMISGAYDASAGEWVAVGGGTGKLGLFYAGDIILNGAGNTAILADDTRFAMAPHGHYWSAPGVPLAPIAVRGRLLVDDDGGGKVSVSIGGGTAEVIVLAMANGRGVVMAEVFLPGRAMSATFRTIGGGDATYVESAGGRIGVVQLSGDTEMDLLGINSNGGTIGTVTNKTDGGDVFDINAGIGDLNNLCLTTSGRLGEIYTGGATSARRMLPRFMPWPPAQDPPVTVPIGIGEDYFTTNGLVAARVGNIKVGEINCADVAVVGEIKALSTFGCIIDSRILAGQICNLAAYGSVRNSTFVTTVGDVSRFAAYNTVADCSIFVAGTLKSLSCTNGIVNTDIHARNLMKLSVTAAIRNTTLDVLENAGAIVPDFVLGGTVLTVGGNLGQFTVNQNMSDSILRVGGNVSQNMLIAGAMTNSILDIRGNMRSLKLQGAVTGSLMNLQGSLTMIQTSALVVNTQMYVGGDLTKITLEQEVHDSIFSVRGDLTGFFTRMPFVASQVIVGGDLRSAQMSDAVDDSRFEVAGTAFNIKAFGRFSGSQIVVGQNLVNLLLKEGITGGTAIRPNLLTVAGDIERAYIYGDISTNTQITVGGLPPAGGESDIRYMQVAGLIYGKMKVYGDVIYLNINGTAPTPTGPQQGFTEAYLLNDYLGEPTGGRIDVGGRAVRIL